MNSGGGPAISKIRLGIFISALILLAGLLIGCGLLGDTTYILDVGVNKEEAGSVHKDPELEEYTEGTTVTITAVSNAGWEFKEWQGDAEGTEESIQVEMDEDKDITAVFEKEEYQLTIEVEGYGAVEIEPDQETYHYGDEVTLTAVPDDGWEFKEWQGDAEGTDPVIEVEMDEDKDIKAIFEREDYSINIDIIGEGKVEKEVLSTPEGDYPYETILELTAVPETGWEFKEWQGDAEGTDPVIEIEMDEDKDITAVFEKEEYQLTIEVEGDGVVEIGPDQEKYHYGDEVTLTAVPDTGWEFKEWQGDVEGTDPVIEVEMDEDKEITAIFDEKPLANISVEYLQVGPSNIFRVWVWETNIKGAVGFKILDEEQETVPIGEEMARNTLEETMPLYIVDGDDNVLAIGELTLEELENEDVFLQWAEE